MRMCFLVFMFLLLIMYFAIILLVVVIFYLLFYLFCLWSFDTQWYYRLIQCCSWMFFLCIFSSFYFRFIVSIVFLSHVFGFFFLMLCSAKFQGSIFCLEVNQWQVTEKYVVPVWSATKWRLAQVLLCLGVCFTSLNSKQECDDDS